jgi:O-acetyl-ADP-ribose deacetylase (regulator of RNase III)
MGKGLALAFKKKYPGMMPAYEKACASGQMKPGSVQLIGVDRKTGLKASPGKADLLIANVATKDHWRDPSKIEWVDRGLEKLAGAMKVRNLKSVAIPMLGSGLGGLDWKDVRQSVDRHFSPLSKTGTRVVVLGEGPVVDKQASSEQSPIAAPIAAMSIQKDTPAGPTFAGIGARATPEASLKKLKAVSKILAGKGFVLRSGGADGADSYCEAGADAGGGAKEIYLPWSGFNDRKPDGNSVFAEVGPEHEKIAENYHPKWSKLKPGSRKLMARNASQMLGRDLKSPSSVVLCWTKGGEPVGGTGQALRMAKDMGIESVNLGDPRIMKMNPEAIARIAVSVSNGGKLGPAIKTERTKARNNQGLEI